MLNFLYQEYNPQHYSFKEQVSKILNVQELERIGENSKIALVDRANDQYTPWHQQFYNSPWLRNFLIEYQSFVRFEIEPIIGEPIVYQTVPTFRVHLPNNLSVGEFHKDSDYGHSTNEINVWVPLTEAVESSAVWLDEGDPENYTVLDSDYGQYILFDGANLEHGNMINETGKTRVSFDFRVIAKSKYRPNPQQSLNSKLKFEIGEYFSELK